MNLRCIYCQTPFTLGRLEMLNAIVTMNERHQNHYDAHCPRCRRANSISRQRMELFFPNWQAAAKELASAPAPVETPAPKVETPATAFLKTEPLPKAAKELIGKAPAEKKAAVKKPTEKAAATPAKEKKPATAKKPAAASKTTTASKAKKPAAKTTPSKAKK
ncbi:MAG: hypothetical protein HY865_18205 [Chloroflexi bacterium]|nr:hypothetical protein [Chloroflexota bacterium]